MIRRIVPWLVLPLNLVATGFASAPWLRAFPSAVLSAPLFGAAVLSVLVPVIAVRLGARRLWQSVLVSLIVFLLYALVIVLQDPTKFGELGSGLVHGPSQILSFALPLVSPRSLLIAPVALCWLTGALAGECLARGWYSLLPYAGWLVAFGLSYAGTVRAAVSNSHDNRLYDTLLGLALLLTLLILRVAQTWLHQDASAETTQADSILPLRGLVIGAVVTVIVGLAAAGSAQSSAFGGRSTTPQRVPAVNNSRPLTPLSFVAGLRPSNPTAAGAPVFSVNLSRSSPNYFDIANVDYYDGDSWSFTRTFRPSGGVVPADTDPSLNPAGPSVTQNYHVEGSALPSAPWMPSIYRPQKVTGVEVNVDAGSGMIVPTTGLRDNSDYTVRSRPPAASFAALPPTALPATSPLPIDHQTPGSLQTTLGELVNGFSQETGVSPSQPLVYLQALLRDLRTNYALASATGVPAPSASASASAPAPSSASSPTASSSAPPGRIGGTAFADVQASILGENRSATPEQYATLFAMIARQLGVPARVATGFRIPTPNGANALPAGTYTATTADAWTWVEIPVRGSGWVIVDPSPSTYGSAAQQSVGAAPSASSSTATPSQNALITQSNGGHAVAPKSAVPHRHAGTHVPIAVLVVLILVAVLLLLLLILLLGKQVRVLRRRRTRDPRRLLLNAWQESLDMLSESGLSDLTTLTSAEVAEATGDQFGPEPASVAAAIGQAANTVIFSSSTPVGIAEAQQAWRAQSALRKLVRRRLPLPRRLAAQLRYHRAPRRSVPIGPTSWAANSRAAASSRRRRRSYTGRRRH